MKNSNGLTYAKAIELLNTESETFDLTNDEANAIMENLQAYIFQNSEPVDFEEFDLERSKQNEVTYKQIKYAEKLAEKTESELPNTSQMMKYCSSETMSGIIDAMKDGRRIRLS